MQLSKATKLIRVSNAVSAGTSDVETTAVDMQGWGGVRWITAFGAITSSAVTSVKAQQGAASNLSDAADLAGTAISIADTDDNKIVSLEVVRPQERYVRLVVDRGTANAVIDSVVAELFDPVSLPSSGDDSTTCVTGESSVEPAEGTA